MRDLADQFVGGFERIDAGVPRQRHGLSLRAVGLGLLLVVLLSVAEPFNQNIYENTMLIGNHLPVAVLFIMLMLVMVVNPVLTLLPRSASALDPARLVVTWFSVLPASVWMFRAAVDPTAGAAVGHGLAGAVVAAVWGLSGALLVVIGVITRRLRSGDPGAAVRARPPSAAAKSLGLALPAAACLAPIALVPLLSRWLDPLPAGVGIDPTTEAVKYAAATAVMLAISLPLARRLRHVDPFSSAELVVVMTMMLSACAVIWSGFHRLWAQQLVAPFYHLQSYPRWEPLVKALPAWLVPSADPQNQAVVYNFYAGDSGVPWAAWGATGLRWAPFVLAFFGGSFFLMALFRRQWEEAEKLPFPLATIALEALRPPRTGNLLNDMFRSRLFWWSTGVVVFFQFLFALHVYYPDFPEVMLKYDLYAALETPPWRHLPHWMRAKEAFFAVVGVTFFLSTEMSFSLWAFVVILALVEMIGKNFQYPIQEQFADHQIGAYIGYAAVIVWVARRHLLRAFRSIWRPAAADAADGHLPERWAAIGFIACFAVAAAWLSFAGIPVHVAVLIAMVVFILSLVIGRVVTESGLLFVQYKCWPHLFAEATFPQLLTPKTHTLIHFTTIAPTMDAREGLMPYAFNSARMADGVEHLKRRRRLFALWIGSLLLALVVAGAAQLEIVYDRGATVTDDWSGRILPEQNYNASADFADLLQRPPDEVRSAWSQRRTRVATGTAIVLALCFLRYRFLGWPLHPIGFIMANTVPMQIFWLSILIGWLCKWLVMKLGGVPVYRKLAPAFLGMIVGTTFSSIFWILVKIASYSGGELGQEILFLPN